MMGIEGVLVIHGIDGKDNKESIKLTSWLFEGKTGYNIEKFTFLGSEYKEFFYIIKADSTAFFYMHDKLYKKLGTLQTDTPPIHVHRLGGCLRAGRITRWLGWQNYKMEI